MLIVSSNGSLGKELVYHGIDAKIMYFAEAGRISDSFLIFCMSAGDSTLAKKRNLVGHDLMTRGNLPRLREGGLVIFHFQYKCGGLL